MDGPEPMQDEPGVPSLSPVWAGAAWGVIFAALIVLCVWMTR